MDNVYAPNPQSPRAAAVYLLAIRPLLATISGGRRALIRSARNIAEDARRRLPAFKQVSLAAGNERLLFFKEAQRQLGTISVPASCDVLHLKLSRWLDRMAQAAEVLITIGITGSPRDLERAQRYMREADELAAEFNDEHERIVVLMRELVTEARVR